MYKKAYLNILDPEVGVFEITSCMNASPLNINYSRSE